MYNRVEFIPVLYAIVEDVSNDIFNTLTLKQQEDVTIWKKARIRKDFIVSYRELSSGRILLHLHNNDTYMVNIPMAELDSIFLK